MTDAAKGLELLRNAVRPHDLIDYDNDQASSFCVSCRAIESLKREDGRRLVMAFLKEVTVATRQKTVRIPVKDKGEAENIERAMADPSTRAFVNIVGALLPLGDRARTRVLTFVNDQLSEDAGRVSITTIGDRHTLEALAAVGQ